MKVLSTLALLLFVLTTNAQDFSGIRTSNYNGVSSVFTNPANIADSRHRWDFSLFNVSTAIGNNKASFKLKDIGKTIDTDSLKNKVFGEGTGPSSGFVSAAVQGPSVFFNLNKKSALAITTRARVMGNIIDIDSKLARQVIDGSDGDNDGFPYTISSATNMVVNANGWTEFGLSYAREILNKGNHYIKGGITLKYLAGAANTSVNIDKLNGTINEDLIADDAYLTNASGKIGLNVGGVDISDIEASSLLEFESSGIGADIGFVYEYRPDTSAAMRDAAGQWRRDLNKYKFKIGVALLDAGSIKYKRDLAQSGGYSINIGAAQRFYLSALQDIDDYKDTLNKYPQFFTPDGSLAEADYNVTLPTTLHVTADYHLKKSFYINLEAQLALTSSRKKIFSSQYYNTVAITPRLETKSIGIYLPLTYHSLTNFNAGAAFRFGPLFLGSGSILSAALGSAKQADFFIGINIGSFHKNK